MHFPPKSTLVNFSYGLSRRDLSYHVYKTLGNDGLHPRFGTAQLDVQMPQIIRTSQAQSQQSVTAKLGDISEYFVISMFDASPDCIAIIELDGTLSFMNENGQSLLEIDDFALIAGEAWIDMWPEAYHDEIDEALELAKDGFASRTEIFSPTTKGTPRWWDVTISPVRNQSGEVDRILSVLRDITHQIDREDKIRRYDLQLKDLNEQQARTIKAKERLLDRQSVLLREIDHRVKNSLAMITSMMRMQAVRETDAKVVSKLQAAANRVMSVGRVHERLYKGDDVTTVSLTDYLGPMCHEIVEAMGTQKIHCRTTIEPMDVSSDTAIAIGLMTSELMSNALRHGLPHGTGNIYVTVGRASEGLKIIIADNGVGLDCPFEPADSEGLGMKVVMLYMQAMKGSIRCENTPAGGASFTILLPKIS